jgi:hypothetical protein
VAKFNLGQSPAAFGNTAFVPLLTKGILFIEGMLHNEGMLNCIRAWM